MPEEVEYLVEWAYRLYGRSGVGFSAVNPLSYGEIEAWARLNDIDLTPEEVEALVVLDDAMRSPGYPEEAEKEEGLVSKEKKPRKGWPTRKAGVVPQFEREEA